MFGEESFVGLTSTSSPSPPRLNLFSSMQSHNNKSNCLPTIVSDRKGAQSVGMSVAAGNWKPFWL